VPRRLRLLLLLALVCSGCQSQDAHLDEARHSIESLRATATTVVRGWLSGDLSDRFARAAVERAYTLAEQTRTRIAQSPQSLADSRAAALAVDCEDLLRLLAQLGTAIDRGDRAAARLALIDVSTASPSYREEDR